MNFAGGMASASSALIEGRQRRMETEMARDVGRFERRNMEQNAQLTAQQSSAREEQQRRESRQLLGSQRAAIGQSGVGFGGSSADIMRQSAAAAELDALNIRYAGDIERVGLLNDITMNAYNDSVLELQGKQAMRLRWKNAASAFFGGQGVQQSMSASMASNKAYGQGYGYTPPKTSHSWASSARGTYGGLGRVGTGPE